MYDNVIKKLLDGNKEFKKKFFSQENSIFTQLAQGQKPKVMIVACSDSRVDPAMIFNADPGELFVIRNVANIVPPYEDNHGYHGTSAALEFGTCFLEVEHIIILGHTKCGGIQALIENADKIKKQEDHSFINKWIKIALPAYDKMQEENPKASMEQKTKLCEQYSLINSLNNLQTFSWIEQAVNNKKLSIHSWYFNLQNGSIESYDQQNDSWKQL